MHDWMVDWFSDSLAALFAVDVTDSVPDGMVAWISDCVAALFAFYVTDLVIEWLDSFNRRQN